MWSLATQSALAAVIFSAATTAALLLRSRRGLYIRFGWFALSIGAYYLTELAQAISKNHLWPNTLSLICGGLVTITGALFLDAMSGDAGLVAQKRRRKTVMGGLAVISVALMGLANNIWILTGCICFLFILLATRVGVMLRLARDVKSKADRTRLKYLAFSGYITLLAVALDIVAQLGWPVPPIGGVFAAFYLYFISQVLLVSRLLDLHELFGKAVVFGTLSLILASLYGVLVVWADQKPGLFLFNTLIASGLILILYEPLRAFLEEQTARFFFKEHVTFARDLRQAAKQLATIVELQPAIDFVLNQIYDQKRATHASIYLYDVDGLGFSLQGFRGPKPIPYIEGKQHAVLFRQLLHRQEPILRDSAKRRFQHQRDVQDQALFESLSAMHCELMVPLLNSGKVFGFLCLQNSRMTESYSKDEILALIQLCEQLAITVENSRMFTELKERDRLAALGEMSAGLAHEIRNPLAAIKGAAQALEPSAWQGEDGQLLHIIVEEVNRLNNVVTEFLDYARPFRGHLSPGSVNEMVLRTVQILEHGFDDTIKLELDLESSLPMVNMDSEQLKQVLMNLILNAKDAVGQAGIIKISTRLCKNELGKATQIEMRVHDTGPGISARIRERIFIPFFTTKEGGTGLGLALCQRIVRDHGGTIDVRTVQGKGTTFIAKLPTIRTASFIAPKTTLNKGIEDVFIAN